MLVVLAMWWVGSLATEQRVERFSPVCFLVLTDVTDY